MDITVLPNNNHPEKFLQLDVGMLPGAHGMFQLGAAMSSNRHWQNRVYFQQRALTEKVSSPSPESSPVIFIDRYLENHITPVTFKPNIKQNPLYTDMRTIDTGSVEKFKPSWTVQDYDRQTVHGSLADHMREGEKTPKDLDFWLEDLYTPGFDSLLKKKEAEHRRKKLCKILASVILSICAIIIIITVPVMVTKKKN
ncbi:major intrinsically disordered NOTCH2-binding receptor 1-like [Myripristis murdjan]|uniref:major intrinsically disordered NOTCH2-binding receptor 1-like n=1 Tax=Myripristis murdjan TaxID=586833 RepID=UPI001176086C|nr:major intrinsically disordered NOTCH2-binding receptor 1-like [Myripristis murdjan]